MCISEGVGFLRTQLECVEAQVAVTLARVNEALEQTRQLPSGPEPAAEPASAEPQLVNLRRQATGPPYLVLKAAPGQAPGPQR